MIRGGDALRGRLTELADRGAVHGWHAQISYLTRTGLGRDIASDRFGARNLIAWLRGPDTPGGRAPSSANQTAIATLYTRRRHEAMAPILKRRLNNDGEGTVIEVYAAEEVKRQSKGGVEDQRLLWHDWDQIIDHWLDDSDLIYEDWDDMSDELYPAGAYASVSHLGF